LENKPEQNENQLFAERVLNILSSKPNEEKYLLIVK